MDEGIALHERGASAACTGAQWAEAEQAALQALAIFEGEDGLDSPDVANLCNLLAEIAEAQGQYMAAEAHARRAWEIMERLGSGCVSTEAEAIRGDTLIRLGTALRGAARYAEAESWLVRALEHAERTGRGLPAALNALGVLCKYTGNFVVAEQLYRAALGLVAEDSAEAATLHHNIGGLAHVRGEFAAGLADARRAWDIRRELRGADHPETLSDACAYATLLDGLGRYDESESIYQAALIRFEELFGDEHLEIAINLSNLAAVRWERKDAAAAEWLYRRAAVMKGKLLGVSHPDTALTLHNYASMLADLGRTGEARDLELKALTVFEAALDPFHPWRVAAQALWQRLNTQQVARASLG
jgi:tetratricopeptide (TPR) repeat protein